MIKQISGFALTAPLMAGVLFLSGCAAPPQRYYTLALRPSASTSGALQRLQKNQQPLRIEVMPVRVPERLNRSNLVVSNSDGTLTMLEQDRWSASLPDELRDAMSQQLQADLGAIDTYRQGGSAAGRWYRISVEVVQLDAAPGQHIDAVFNWTVLPLPGGTSSFGRSTISLPVGTQVGSVVAAYQDALASSAADIAEAVRASVEK